MGRKLRNQQQDFTQYEIGISEHAFQRWNERVGPFLSNKFELLNAFQNYFDGNTDRVTIHANHIEFDDEIVAGYVINEEAGILTITTFFGRKSLTPALNNYEDLTNILHFFQQYNIDRVNLAVSDEQLNDQRLPTFPIETKNVKLNCNIYKVLRLDQEHYKVIQTSGNGYGQSVKFHINQIHNLLRLSIVDTKHTGKISHYDAARLMVIIRQIHLKREDAHV